jgi:hypothetical protein
VKGNNPQSQSTREVVCGVVWVGGCAFLVRVELEYLRSGADGGLVFGVYMTAEAEAGRGSATTGASAKALGTTDTSHLPILCTCLCLHRL